MENNVEKKWVKGLKLGLNIFFYVVIVVLLLFSIANLAQRNYKKPPSLFSFGFMNVATDSMTPKEGDPVLEDSLFIGDLIFVRILNEKRVKELKVGDIVTFYDKTIEVNGKKGGFNTHRIYKIFETDNGTAYQTKGDHLSEEEVDTVLKSADELLAVYTGKWSGAGKALAFAQSPLGFGLIVILPIFLILVYQAVILILNITSANKQKLIAENEVRQEELQQQLELEKERIRQQVLEELKNEKKKD